MDTKIFKFMAVVAVATLFTSLLSFDWYIFWNSPTSPSLEQPILLNVEKGDSLNKVSHKLIETNIFSRPMYLKAYLRYQNLFDYFKYGDYVLDPKKTPNQILAQLEQGRVQAHSIIIIPGLSWDKLYSSLSNNPLLVNDLDSEEKRNSLCHKHHISSLEGWLAPDTYKVSKYTKLSSLVSMAIKQQKSLLQSAAQQNLCSLTDEETIVLASIIEKESAHEDEYALISSTYHNRLALGMRLQSDPTVLYGLRKSNSSKLTFRDLKQDHDHNTYRRYGLPPTAIAYPSKHAIIAACFPASTDYLFFVAKKDLTGHIFSKNFKEHIDVKKSQKP